MAMRQWSEEEKRRHRVRSVTAYAVLRGVLTKQPCARCGAAKVQAHHTDYERPLEVVWLCRPCHLTEHAQGRDHSLCTKCGDEPRAGKSVWGRQCLAAAKAAQRGRAKVPEPVLTAADLGQEIGCRVCVARRAAVQAVVDAHVRLVGDPGLLGRVKWAGFVDKLMAALE